MNIRKENLRMGIWYEDDNRNMYRTDAYGRPNEDCTSYHVQFPLSIQEKVNFYYENKSTCKHKRKYRERTWGWKKGIKGCKCNSCGKTKTGKSWKPFLFMKWGDGCDTREGYAINTHIGGGNEAVILAMANSGDYTLSEAITAYATACERCMNVLEYKYLDGKAGYEEFSDEWYKCGTVCDFCNTSKKG